MFITQGWRQSPDQIEKTIAPRSNVGTVLDVIGRPEASSSVVVTPIEQGVESFEDECFVLLLIIDGLEYPL